MDWKKHFEKKRREEFLLEVGDPDSIYVEIPTRPEARWMGPYVLPTIVTDVLTFTTTEPSTTTGIGGLFF